MPIDLNNLLQQFKSLSPDKQKLFRETVNSSLPTKKVYTLDKLIQSKCDEGILCPHCHSIEIVKNGTQANKQRYKCKSCNKTFTILSDTFLAWTKKDFQVWKKFVYCMIEGFSVRKSATICKINRNTAFVWRHKILDCLSTYVTNQNSMKGIVEADDTFFRLSFKGNKSVQTLPYRNTDNKRKRGLSKQQVCVSCAIARDKKTVYSKIATLGRAKVKDLQKVFKGHLSKKAILCTDKDKAYRNFAKQIGLEHIQLQSGTASKMGVYHIQTINSYHSRLKFFIRRFRGVSTKYLNNYLVWNNIIQERKYKKIKLLKMCIKVINNIRWSMLNDRPVIPV